MRRPLAVTVVLAAIVVAAGACDRFSVSAPHPAPSTPSPAATPVRTSARPTASSPAPTTYPAAARAYAEQALAAWSQLRTPALTDLTSPDALRQLQGVNSPPNQAWTFQSCDGAAGSTFCAFGSPDGDVLTVRLTNPLLGKAHAVVEVRFDPTTYATDPSDYVRTFVEAWRNGNTRRMLALANQVEVDYFSRLTPPATYTVCGARTGGAWSVGVYSQFGADYAILGTGSALGNKHAITGHTEVVTACT